MSNKFVPHVVPELPPQQEDEGGGKRSQADRLLDLTKSECDLFRDRAGKVFADISREGHRETLAVESRGFQDWLTIAFLETHGRALSQEAIRTALNTLTAKGRLNGPERDVFVRVGEHEGAIYLDLCDTQWRAVKIDANGWEILQEPPIRFVRSPDLQPLPEPIRGGSLDRLRDIINLPDEEQFILAVGWLLGALRGKGPFPILAVSGERGAAKSSLVSALQFLIDPNSSGLRSPPKNEQDIFIAAQYTNLICYDNISTIPDWLNDALCRLSTGGSYTTRRLYTDAEEHSLSAMRPIALTAIEDIVQKNDLVSRSIFLALPSIDPTRRKTESEIKALLERERPSILGALLDAVSRGLRRLPDTLIEGEKPRLLDFACWAVACGDGELWRKGAFLKALQEGQKQAEEEIGDSDPLVLAIRELMAASPQWEGTASDLLSALSSSAPFWLPPKPKRLPENPRALSSRLRSMAPSLQSGTPSIEVVFGVRREGKKMIRLLKGTKGASVYAKAPPHSAINPLKSQIFCTQSTQKPQNSRNSLGEGWRGVI
jgi:hypothetical protein